MSIIKTQRNHVAAYEPQAGDVAVVTRLGTVEVVQPIHRYGAAVHQAMAMADNMQAHVDVVPVDTVELLSRNGMTPEAFMASLSPQEREQLRQDSITACTDAIRYSDDPELAALAAETLHMLGADSPRQVH